MNKALLYGIFLQGLGTAIFLQSAPPSPIFSWTNLGSIKVSEVTNRPVFISLLDDLNVDIGIKGPDVIYYDIVSRPYSEAQDNLLKVVLGVTDNTTLYNDDIGKRLIAYMDTVDTINDLVQTTDNLDDAARMVEDVRIVQRAGNLGVGYLLAREAVDIAYKNIKKAAQKLGNAGKAILSEITAQYNAFKILAPVRAAIDTINHAASGVQRFNEASIRRAVDLIQRARNLPEAVVVKAQEAYQAFATKLQGVAERVGIIDAQGNIRQAGQTAEVVSMRPLGQDNPFYRPTVESAAPRPSFWQQIRHPGGTIETLQLRQPSQEAIKYTN